jgi:hypothetical protein
MINKPEKNINSRPVANATKISSGRPILHVAGDLQNLFGRPNILHWFPVSCA